MDKKSANGFQTKASEGGVQRKQLPYSVETPYGFHLDLDFLKYVDDIEKGNTIKRVHIQRRVKGPPKFSTLPRNFSLPGHGIRPTPKDSQWSGTSTLGPKPKSRLTEVHQISEFRTNEGGILSRGTASQGTSVVAAKVRDEGVLGAQGIEDKTMGTQNRPNLLRASSMPITLQQRKGSDSSSPDRIVGTPENGSTENMFRASPDVTERRSVPQERVGIHQQITVALKRVRELEEQVKTIPELKAQICSLRMEREKLLSQLQSIEKAHISTSSSKMALCIDPGINTQSHATRHKEGLNLSLTPQTNIHLETSKHLTTQPLTEKGRQGIAQAVNQRLVKSSSACDDIFEQSSNMKANFSDKQNETVGSPVEHASQEDDNVVKGGNFERPASDQNLHDKLVTLEAKLLQAREELEKTNGLLKEQITENKMKEERILLMREGVRVEVSPTETQIRPRRDSIDTGTETEKVDYSNQETETEIPGTVDQGTDTERICIEVCVSKSRSGSIDQGTETTRVDTHDKMTEVEPKSASVGPQRPIVNSMEQGTVTERAATQDQVTKTLVARRVHQVLETEGETETNHPQRPRASSVDRGTETERVDTVDRVTEMEVAQRIDQHTETELEIPQNNKPSRNTEADSQVRESPGSQRGEVDTVVSESIKDNNRLNEGIQKDHEDNTNMVLQVAGGNYVAAKEGVVEQTLSLEFVTQPEPSTSPTGENTESENEINPLKTNSESEAIPKSLELQKVAQTTTNTLDTATVASESANVKTEVPVRPQRGRRPSADQAQQTIYQLQTAPVRPRRGSSETQSQQSKTVKESQSPTELSEPLIKHESPSLGQSGNNTTLPSNEKQSQSQPQTEIQCSSLMFKEAQTRPKSIQAQSKTITPRDSKELEAPNRASSVSQSLRRGSGDNHTDPKRQGLGEVQTRSRRRSEASQSLQKDPEVRKLRRGSSETAQLRRSGEALAPRHDIVETQQVRRGSSESPTSPAALGQVVTRLTGLLGEQWAQLGSSSGAQQSASQQESPGTQKQTAGKGTEAGNAASPKPVGKAATTGKPAGKPGPSKMSSIQSQLVSSLSVLSAFYSPGQKSATANKQQEQSLKSIMKKNGVADKQGNKGTKKNLKFVGVNGGYESTSSEESSGDEKAKVDVEEGDSSEAEEERGKEPNSAEKPEEGADAQEKDAEILCGEEGAVAAEKESEKKDLLDRESSQELLEEPSAGEKVDKGFIDACLYVKDRMEEVTSPDKEMVCTTRQVLVVLYQEWFKVSSQKTSQADTVRSYLRQVGLTTPTLLPYVVNLTDGNGNMALHYSVSHSNFPVVKLLLDTGLCETDNINKAGYTPVMLAALTAAESPDDLEVAQQLLRLGDVNARSRQTGQTALMLAVSHGRLAMVKLLLSCGADVNAQDGEGSTALMCASEHGHTHIARLLLETGHCDTSLTDKNGQNAQEVAEGASHPDIVDLLKGPRQA
ncbi:KN motif and ankyrin repeat domain-containing protein 4 isoform X1 [Entelurus aequoreus]|uniref:KN motif and ankyrin repeat domain-containing protein 4 isoform X1 n=1 Tax=Entelurus aequoreus TaxID=161455 RepID=UPI002B1E3E31|nr:KN motif and ankyrin repeat domain-containing protein 4 isoform X1 [Entelurus aequoreus]XP_061884231.1 KN motif and ankyrin repeat domain-containing protein 4 isoform X1 [Entelurus aequoreus]XP_061884232.1 KN motif and ankyrin repeat domain-containing protein 4 isoform X1 [Entelurus aequoreus]